MSLSIVPAPATPLNTQFAHLSLGRSHLLKYIERHPDYLSLHRATQRAIREYFSMTHKGFMAEFARTTRYSCATPLREAVTEHTGLHQNIVALVADYLTEVPSEDGNAT